MSLRGAENDEWCQDKGRLRLRVPEASPEGSRVWSEAERPDLGTSRARPGGCTLHVNRARNPLMAGTYLPPSPRGYGGAQPGGPVVEASPITIHVDQSAPRRSRSSKRQSPAHCPNHRTARRSIPADDRMKEGRGRTACKVQPGGAAEALRIVSSPPCLRHSRPTDDCP
jgi:hypothetical protein